MAKNASPTPPQAPQGINLVYVALGVILFLGIMLFTTGRLMGNKTTDSNPKAEVVNDGQVNFETVAKSQNSNFKERIFYTINTEEEWRSLWASVHAVVN